MNNENHDELSRNGTIANNPLATAIRKAMMARGISTREVVQRVPRRHVGTVYRLLAGRTTDPWASTLASLCSAIGVDPNELLSVDDPLGGFEPEVRAVLESVNDLPEADRWLVLGILRAAIGKLSTAEPAS